MNLFSYKTIIILPLPLLAQQSGLDAPFEQQKAPYPPLVQQSGPEPPLAQQSGLLAPFIQQNRPEPPLGHLIRKTD